MSKTKILFHGSPDATDMLIPCLSHVIRDVNQNVLFATPYPEIALIFSGNMWHDFVLSSVSIDNQISILELKPDMFEEVFDTAGYLYTFPSDGFEVLPESGGNHYISKTAVINPIRIPIPNVFETIRQTSVRLVEYENISLKEWERTIDILLKKYQKFPEYAEFIEKEKHTNPELYDKLMSNLN